MRNAVWLLAPAVVLGAQVEEKPKDLPFLAQLAFYRGGILFLQAPSQMVNEIRSDKYAARLDKVLVRDLVPGGETSRKLGLNIPGVYFLDRNGTVLREVHGDALGPFEDILGQLGWLSPDQAYEAFLKEDPGRLDVLWKVWNKALVDLGSNPSKEVLSRVGRALDALLKEQSWGEVPNVFQTPPPKPEKADPENEVGTLATRYWNTVETEVRRSPEHSPLWQVASFLAEWSSESHWLYRLIQEIPPPPLEDVDLAAWPNSQALDQAELQLRSKKNWRGLKEFAESRISLVDAYAKSFSPEAANAWSGTMILSGEKVIKPSRKEKLSSTYGKWMLLAFDASLEEGRMQAAHGWAVRLQQEGDQESQRKALYLAEAFHQTELAVLHRLGIQVEHHQ